jgi:hypothetical protein
MPTPEPMPVPPPRLPASPAPALPLTAGRRPVEIDDDLALPHQPAPHRPPLRAPSVPRVVTPTLPPQPEPSEPAAPAVPTWAVRRPSPFPTGPVPQFVGDIAIDPRSLRPKLTVRAGLSSLTVDGRQLVLRTGIHRERLPWSMVNAFEPRFPDGDESPADQGVLVAMTPAGAIELPATRRHGDQLRHVHALLDAYRVRAQQLANR